MQRLKGGSVLAGKIVTNEKASPIQWDKSLKAALIAIIVYISPNALQMNALIISHNQMIFLMVFSHINLQYYILAIVNK